MAFIRILRRSPHLTFFSLSPFVLSPSFFACFLPREDRNGGRTESKNRREGVASQTAKHTHNVQSPQTVFHEPGEPGPEDAGVRVVAQAQKRAEPHGVRQAGTVREVRQDGRQKKGAVTRQHGAHPGRRHCHRRVQEPEARHGPGADGQAQRVELDDPA